MKIYISGASGFIGSSLVEFLSSLGHEVYSVPRVKIYADVAELADFVSGADVMINLNGAPILGRWSKSYKRMLHASRIGVSRKLYKAFEYKGVFPKYMINASAVGVYDQFYVQTEEDQKYAKGFLPDLIKDWESETLKFSMRSNVYILRFGAVLGKGGALEKMSPLFKYGLGAVIGRGRQFMPWIHVDDVVNIVQWILQEDADPGVYNVVAPERITNAQFSKALAKAYRKPLFMNVPPVVIKMLYGRGSQVLLEGQEVIPEKLLKRGYVFRFPEIQGALDNIIGKGR